MADITVNKQKFYLDVSLLWHFQDFLRIRGPGKSCESEKHYKPIYFDCFQNVKLSVNYALIRRLMFC